jgi:demethylmenaquinone methyltransferase/2-methoxy-6-polyprenyl-1,4-benzoquinol methylase
LVAARSQIARPLFAPIGASYERWARLLSFGQDARWRRAMVDGLAPGAGRHVLDVAAGTGSITRLLQERGYLVTAVDLTSEMLSRHTGPWRVLARGERLPFGDSTFDGLTFGYLLRYVDDPGECLAEMARVVKPGGIIGMVEFGHPSGVWRLPWGLFTGVLLPVAGRVIGGGWQQVGAFLRDSIVDFHTSHPNLEALWRASGLIEVNSRRMSLGGGLVMWGRRP